MSIYLSLLNEVKHVSCVEKLYVVRIRKDKKLKWKHFLSFISTCKENIVT